MLQCCLGYGLISSSLEARYIWGIPTMETTKEKKVRPNKKVLLRGIAENSNNFNLPSLERTNIQNLKEIERLVILARG